MKYLFLFSILSLAISSCRENKGVIDPPFFAPHISSLSIAQSVFDTDTMNVKGMKTPLDTVTISTSISVRASDTLALRDVILQVEGAVSDIELLDNGKAPDVKAGDSVYTGLLSQKRFRRDVGTLPFIVVAHNTSGMESTTIAGAITIVNSGNRAPSIDSIIAPDTVVVPANDSTVLYSIACAVSDSEGIEDIAHVYYDVLDSAGAVKLANVTLYDDGRSIHGDASERDGIFSNKFAVTQSAASTRGSFRDFRFTAMDKSNAKSASRTKRIYVK